MSFSRGATSPSAPVITPSTTHLPSTRASWGTRTPARCQSYQRICFGPLPDYFLLFSPKSGAVLHGTLTTADASLSSFVVLNGFLETTIGDILVHFGGAKLVTTTHNKDLGFLPAHQRTNNFVNQAVVDQRLNALGYFQVVTSSEKWMASASWVAKMDQNWPIRAAGVEYAV